MTKTAIVSAGKPFEDLTNAMFYEKLSADNEFVAGRIATKGTAQTQAKLATFGAAVIGVFGLQQGFEGQSSPGIYDDYYAQDGKSVRIEAFGPFAFNGTLDDGETVTKGDKLTYETTTGKLLLYSGQAPVVAIALEDKAASGADEDILCLYVADKWGLSVVTETLAVTTDVITLTYDNVAAVVSCVEQTANIGYHVGVGVTATDNAVAVLDPAAHTVTFEASDLADAVDVIVSYLV